MNRLKWMRLVVFVGGMLEFLLAGLMFVMAGLSIAGYVVWTYYPQVEPLGFIVETSLGIFAVFAFFVGLVGAVSALQRWSMFLSVLGASFIACWGLLEIYLGVTFLNDIFQMRLVIELGTFALFFSMLLNAVFFAMRDGFKPQALKRSSYS